MKRHIIWIASIIIVVLFSGVWSAPVQAAGVSISVYSVRIVSPCSSYRYNEGYRVSAGETITVTRTTTNLTTKATDVGNPTTISGPSTQTFLSPVHPFPAGTKPNDIIEVTFSWTGSETGSVTIDFNCFLGYVTGDAKHCTVFKDGRLNSCDAAEPVAVYCAKDGSVNAFVVYNGRGYQAFSASAAKIASVPLNVATNTQIIDNMGVQLYRLTSGELQINYNDAATGKNYVFHFSGCQH